ncbi:DUF4259 domain-containing protein [Deinococcus aquiradiocola]|uniref:DUF4259 domain-containing protein n=1 Tax=Deinococcus aquiradiocola TaxID=393059 RepID=A0A917PEK4_9DEIO|nr:DUF4259 domain-containing protein [Deinococcus aquiradiocola]GGJ72461.1 hypothetical protein GCM10008939_16080 [Deinococcus aquiradiocola]
MSTWGVGSFENESAAMFVKEVVEDGPVALEEALEVVLDPDMDYVELEEGQRAVAAAEIVQVRLSGDTSAVTDAALRAWLDGDDAADGEAAEVGALRDLAVEALGRVLGPGSELPELWQDGPDAREWLADVNRLQAALGGA